MDIDCTQAIALSDLEEEDEPAEEKKQVGYLTVFGQKGFPQTQFPVYEGHNIIGREPSIDISIPLKALSKQHACIEVRGESHFIYDKGSRNKTKRDKLYLLPEVRYELKHKDSLTFADVTCEYIKEADVKGCTGADDGDETSSETDSESMFGQPVVTEAPTNMEETLLYEEPSDRSEPSSDLLKPTQAFACDGTGRVAPAGGNEATLMYAAESDDEEQLPVKKPFTAGAETVADTQYSEDEDEGLDCIPATQYVPESDSDEEVASKTPPPHRNKNNKNNRGAGAQATQAYGVGGEATQAYGIIGEATQAYGVGGEATQAYGVGGEATQAYGIIGEATQAYGIIGEATQAYGITGEATQAYGIISEATQAYGVIAESDSEETPVLSDAATVDLNADTQAVIEESPQMAGRGRGGRETRSPGGGEKAGRGAGEPGARDARWAADDEDHLPTQTFSAARPLPTAGLGLGGGATLAYELNSDDDDDESALPGVRLPFQHSEPVGEVSAAEMSTLELKLDETLPGNAADATLLLDQPPEGGTVRTRADPSASEDDEATQAASEASSPRRTQSFGNQAPTLLVQDTPLGVPPRKLQTQAEVVDRMSLGVADSTLLFDSDAQGTPVLLALATPHGVRPSARGRQAESASASASTAPGADETQILDPDEIDTQAFSETLPVMSLGRQLAGPASDRTTSAADAEMDATFVFDPESTSTQTCSEEQGASRSVARGSPRAEEHVQAKLRGASPDKEPRGQSPRAASGDTVSCDVTENGHFKTPLAPVNKARGVRKQVVGKGLELDTVRPQGGPAPPSPRAIPAAARDTGDVTTQVHDDHDDVTDIDTMAGDIAATQAYSMAGDMTATQPYSMAEDMAATQPYSMAGDIDDLPPTQAYEMAMGDAEGVKAQAADEEATQAYEECGPVAPSSERKEDDTSKATSHVVGTPATTSVGETPSPVFSRTTRKQKETKDTIGDEEATQAYEDPVAPSMPAAPPVAETESPVFSRRQQETPAGDEEATQAYEYEPPDDPVATSSESKEEDTIKVTSHVVATPAATSVVETASPVFSRTSRKQKETKGGAGDVAAGEDSRGDPATGGKTTSKGRPGRRKTPSPGGSTDGQKGPDSLAADRPPPDTEVEGTVAPATKESPRNRKRQAPASDVGNQGSASATPPPVSERRKRSLSGDSASDASSMTSAKRSRGGRGRGRGRGRGAHQEQGLGRGEDSSDTESLNSEPGTPLTAHARERRAGHAADTGRSHGDSEQGDVFAVPEVPASRRGRRTRAVKGKDADLGAVGNQDAAAESKRARKSALEEPAGRRGRQSAVVEEPAAEPTAAKAPAERRGRQSAVVEEPAEEPAAEPTAAKAPAGRRGRQSAVVEEPAAEPTAAKAPAARRGRQSAVADEPAAETTAAKAPAGRRGRQSAVVVEPAAESTAAKAPAGRRGRQSAVVEEPAAEPTAAKAPAGRRGRPSAVVVEAAAESTAAKAPAGRRGRQSAVVVEAAAESTAAKAPARRGGRQSAVVEEPAAEPTAAKAPAGRRGRQSAVVEEPAAESTAAKAPAGRGGRQSAVVVEAAAESTAAKAPAGRRGRQSAVVEEPAAEPTAAKAPAGRGGRQSAVVEEPAAEPTAAKAPAGRRGRQSAVVEEPAAESTAAKAPAGRGGRQSAVVEEPAAESTAAKAPAGRGGRQSAVVEEPAAQSTAAKAPAGRRGKQSAVVEAAAESTAAKAPAGRGGRQSAVVEEPAAQSTAAKAPAGRRGKQSAVVEAAAESTAAKAPAGRRGKQAAVAEEATAGSSDESQATPKGKGKGASKRPREPEPETDSLPQDSPSAAKSRKASGGPRTPARGSSQRDPDSQASTPGTPTTPGTPSLRRHIVRKPLVMFTGVVDESGQKVLTKLGGTIADSMADCTHLVTDQVRRTVKFLCGVARGIHIVSPLWLTRCKDAATFLDASPFVVKDPDNEKKFGFKLSVSLERAAGRPLLAGYSIHVTRSVRPDPDAMKEIICCAGAKFEARMPKKSRDGLVVVSCADDRALCERPLACGVPVVSAEFILTGMLTQDADYEPYRLFAEEEGSESSTATTQRGSKRTTAGSPKTTRKRAK